MGYLSLLVYEGFSFLFSPSSNNIGTLTNNTASSFEGEGGDGGMLHHALLLQVSMLMETQKNSSDHNLNLT